jgi:hypothetical protein
MLPKGAPVEFKDRETLWNAVEKAEKRQDAQLAREINVALPIELSLGEQIELLHEFVKINFVDKGMIADFAIHHTNRENPHGHIMPTTRSVTPKGFGNKNRVWNDRRKLAEWRKSWADVNNRAFERKGLDVRIDHRSYKDQGIDKEPQIHMGHKAWALEKKGVRTEKGDYNREIQRRNKEREERKKQHTQEIRKNTTNINSDKQFAPIKTEPFENNVVYRAVPETVQKSRELEEYLKAEKAAKILGKMQAKRESRETKEATQHMSELRNEFFTLAKAENQLKIDCLKLNQDIPPLEYRTEILEEYTKNIHIKQHQLEHAQQERQKSRLWELEKKRYWDTQIHKAKQALETTHTNFKRKFNIEPSQAHTEIQRTQKLLREKTHQLTQNKTQLQQINTKQQHIKTKCQTLKITTQHHQNNEQNNELFKETNPPYESTRDILLRQQITRELDTITDERFYQILKTLPEQQAKSLSHKHEQTKTKELHDLSKSPEHTKGHER